jgi:hypothetical protein
VKAHTSKATSNATEPEAAPPTPDQALKLIKKALQRTGLRVEEAMVGTVMSHNDPKIQNFIFCRMVFNFAAMPEDEWDEFKGAGGQPCGEEDCDCHLRGQKLMDLLQEVRDAT